MKTIKHQPDSPGRFTRKNSKGKPVADHGSRKSYADSSGADDYEGGKNQDYDKDMNDQATRFKNEKQSDNKGDYNTDEGKKKRR